MGVSTEYMGASSLRWHPYPFRASDAIVFGEGEFKGPEYHYLIAQCFAWHDSNEETAAADSDVSEIAWLTVQEVNELAKGEGVWFSNGVLASVRYAERLVDSGVMVADF